MHLHQYISCEVLDQRGSDLEQKVVYMIMEQFKCCYEIINFNLLHIVKASKTAGVKLFRAKIYFCLHIWVDLIRAWKHSFCVILLGVMKDL